MALTLVASTPTIGSTRRPLLARFSTDQDIVSGGVANNTISSLDTAAADGDTWVFNFNEFTVTFTAKTTPQQNGNEFPAGTTLANAVIPYLQSNYFLNLYYDISEYDTDDIQFIAKAKGAKWNLLHDNSTWTGFTQWQFIDGEDETILENFQAWLDLYIEQVRDGGDYGSVPIAKLTATQSAAGFFDFDLSAILDAYVEDDPPMPFSGVVLLTQLPLRRFKFQYNEAWGSPIAPGAITESSEYFGFRGRREHESAGTTYNAFSDIFLTDRPLTKTLWRQQADYLYFLTDRRNAVTINVIAYDRAGAGLASYPITVPSYAGWTVMKIPTGPDQLSLHADTASYTMQITYGAGAQVRTYTFNVVGKCPAHSTYLLFRNALGGYDSLPITGRKTATLATQHQEASKILPANYTNATPERIRYDITAQDELQCHTGWVFTKAEVEYYSRQFFMSENILLPGAEGLIPYTLLTKEVLVTRDRTNLYGFGFKLRKSTRHMDRHTSYFE